MPEKCIFQECMLQDWKPTLGSIISEYIRPKSNRESEINPHRWVKQVSPHLLQLENAKRRGLQQYKNKLLENNAAQPNNFMKSVWKLML